MVILGLVGGIASGKSEVARQFAQLGAAVLDADVWGHEILELPEVIQAAAERWGREIVGAQGQLRRDAVAQRVFAPGGQGAADLEFWENQTHPRIAQRLAARLRELRVAGGVPLAVLDAAVMCKAGWDQHCDSIVFVDTPRAERLRRARLRGWSPVQFDARERAQLSVAEKRRRADFVIDNSGTLDQTYEQVLALWNAFSV